MKESGLSHNFLIHANIPKYAAREAEIVAQAGRKRAITISTNMVGRGADIILGGNPKMLAREAIEEKVILMLAREAIEEKAILMLAREAAVANIDEAFSLFTAFSRVKFSPASLAKLTKAVVTAYQYNSCRYTQYKQSCSP